MVAPRKLPIVSWLVIRSTSCPRSSSNAAVVGPWWPYSSSITNRVLPKSSCFPSKTSHALKIECPWATSRPCGRAVAPVAMKITSGLSSVRLAMRASVPRTDVHAELLALPAGPAHGALEIPADPGPASRSKSAHPNSARFFHEHHVVALLGAYSCRLQSGGTASWLRRPFS